MLCVYELLSGANKITEHRIEIGKLRTAKVLPFFKKILLLYIKNFTSTFTCSLHLQIILDRIQALFYTYNTN